MKKEHVIKTYPIGKNCYQSVAVVNGVTVTGKGLTPLESFFPLASALHFSRDNWKFRCPESAAEKTP